MLTVFTAIRFVQFFLHITIKSGARLVCPIGAVVMCYVGCDGFSYGPTRAGFRLSSTGTAQWTP